jgi:hypothetical protein
LALMEIACHPCLFLLRVFLLPKAVILGERSESKDARLHPTSTKKAVILSEVKSKAPRLFPNRKTRAEQRS